MELDFKHYTPKPTKIKGDAYITPKEKNSVVNNNENHIPKIRPVHT